MRSTTTIIDRASTVTSLLTLIRTHWGILTWIILITITALSLWPLDTLPSVPGSDKSHHLIAYALLIFPVALHSPRRWLLYGLVFILYSGGIELIQPFVNRYGEWLDWVANMVGVVCGVMLASLLQRIYLSASYSQR